MKLSQYTHIGKRKTNQDDYGNGESHAVVCDGVGGSVNGGYASSFVVKALQERIGILRIDSVKGFKELVKDIQHELNFKVREDERLEGAATTLAMVVLAEKGLFIGHMGDSRILVVRRGGTNYWQTKDHSLVAQMLARGEIDLKTAQQHPMRNRITNAIKGNSEDMTSELEVNFLSDLKEGDSILICSDGVLESFSERELIHIIGSVTKSVEDKLDTIKTGCISRSDDNNTAVLIELEACDTANFGRAPSEWNK